MPFQFGVDFSVGCTMNTIAQHQRKGKDGQSLSTRYIVVSIIICASLLW